MAPLRSPHLSYLSAAVVAILFSASGIGCDALSLAGDATFTGLVVDSATEAPVVGATVTVDGTAASATTDADGRFEVIVAADSTGQTLRLTAIAPGYAPGVQTATADVGSTVAVTAFRLAPLDDGTVASGPAASVTLGERSSETVSVVESGAEETATLGFVVLDGAGRPIDAEHAVELRFEIVNGPGGGESLFPTEATTASDGTAVTTLTSGTRSGTVQVAAVADVDGGTIRSQPVTVTITGGLPDALHFSVAPFQLNFAGYNRYGLTNEVTAFVGDKYGNPVQPQTAVYFTTDGGIIEGSGTTQPIGTATVNLLSAAPAPSNASSCSTTPNGYARVTARTSNEQQETIETEATVLFSGLTTISIVTPGLEIQPYTFIVADQFGHPLAPGTAITFAADGVNVRSVGDADFILGDHLCPGPGRTEFRVGVTIADLESTETPFLETITVSVISPNGNARLTRSASGLTAGDDVLARLD